MTLGLILCEHMLFSENDNHGALFSYKSGAMQQTWYDAKTAPVRRIKAPSTPVEFPESPAVGRVGSMLASELFGTDQLLHTLSAAVRLSEPTRLGCRA